MPRAKNWLPIVSRQFWTLNYPRPKCLLKYLPNCLSPTREDIFSSFFLNPVVRVIPRQLSGKNCLAAIFASRHQDTSLGPLGRATQEARMVRLATCLRLTCNRKIAMRSPLPEVFPFDPSLFIFFSSAPFQESILFQKRLFAFSLLTTLPAC